MASTTASSSSPAARVACLSSEELAGAVRGVLGWLCGAHRQTLLIPGALERLLPLADAHFSLPPGPAAALLTAAQPADVVRELSRLGLAQKEIATALRQSVHWVVRMLVPELKLRKKLKSEQ